MPSVDVQTLKVGDTTKTYTLLSSIPKTPVVKCSALLENKMQCWRAGDYLVREESPAVEGDDLPPDSVNVRTYQLCRHHAVAQWATDEQAIKALAAQNEPETTAPTEEKKQPEAPAPQVPAPRPSTVTVADLKNKAVAPTPPTPPGLDDSKK